MTGQEYEQFVRAVLAERLKLTRNRIKSMRSPGATLPLAPELQHQIDLMYIHDNEVAEYITIIECKYRSSGYVDQPDLQNLAFVRESVKAHKAMMVTNKASPRARQPLRTLRRLRCSSLTRRLSLSTLAPMEMPRSFSVSFRRVSEKLRTATT